MYTIIECNKYIWCYLKKKSMEGLVFYIENKHRTAE